MENVMNVAAYITNRYLAEYEQPIDEMKLHKDEKVRRHLDTMMYSKLAQ